MEYMIIFSFIFNNVSNYFDKNINSFKFEE